MILAFCFDEKSTLHETNVAPENGWLEYTPPETNIAPKNGGFQ